MRSILLVFFLSTVVSSFSQIIEDFSDGDFSDGNPLTWVTSQESGSNDFAISSGEVQSDGPSSTTSIYLSTDLGIDFNLNDVEWIFKVRYSGGAPSNSNSVEVYLMSNTTDLINSPEGYYIRMGENGSGDGIDFFKTNSGIALISDASNLVASSLDVNIRIKRLGNGDWTLEADNSGGSNFSMIGSVSDMDFNSGSNFGLVVNHTSTRNQSFFFDDVTVTIIPTLNATPPTILSAKAINDTQVEVQFSENVDQTTAETSGNYVINNSISVSSADRDVTDLSLVTLTVSALTNGETFELTINNVEDESGNVIATDSQESFQYLVFEEAVEFDVVINEFMPDPNPVIGLPDAEFVELYNRSNKFFDLANWTLDGQALPSFTFAPDSYVIVVEDDDAGLFGAFSNVLSISTLSLNNSSADNIELQDDNTSVIHSIAFQGSSGGTSIELINPNGPDYSYNNYGLSTDADGGTPGEQNAVFDDTPDTTPPTIQSIAVQSATELLVTFNEPVGQVTAEDDLNYSINGGISVSSATRDGTDNSLVTLMVSALTSGEVRTLTINGVEDLSGNAIVDGTIDFEYIKTEEASTNEVVINEFYAIPDAESGIPNAEFIELYNRSSKFIDLENWTLNDASGTSSFGAFILRPDSYVIVCRDSDAASFDSFGDVMGLSSVPSLNNSSDNVVIRNSVSDTIHITSYTSATSGITTELINPNGPDYSSNNYGLSTDADGGTPGEQNAIFDDTPDTTPPSIESIEVISSTELDVTFDEPLGQSTAEDITNYSIDGGIIVSGANLDSSNNNLVHLTVSTLVSAEVRTLTVNGVEDLSGNAIVNETTDFEYIETEEAEKNDVVINEFYAMPDAESGIPNAEFVELYNRSSKFIDLENWTLNDASGSSTSFSSFILRPDSYVIVCRDSDAASFDSFGDVLGLSSVPSLNNSSDNVVIRNSVSDTIHVTSYTSATSGITTELINPNGPDYSSNNYGLSTDPDGGTPGEQNSIFDDTPDTTPPSIESIEVISSTELDVTFDEPLGQSTAEDITNYSIDGGITVSSTSLDVSNNLVHLTVSTLVSAEVRTLTVNGVEDLSGNAIVNETTDFEYIETEEAVANEVVINEFYAIPDAESSIPNAEFVELYNRSSKFIDMENWTLNDASGSSSSFSSFILRPDSYVIVCRDSDAASFDSFGDVLGLSSVPSLNNSSDNVVIRNSVSDTIHITSYTLATSGITTELINPNGPHYSENNYGLSTNADGGTPGEQNSIFDDTPDTTPPSIESIEVISSTELDVTFDEPLEQMSSEDITSYSVDGGIIVSGANLDSSNNNLVHLTVSTLVSAEIRTLTVNGVEDLSGNAAVDGTIDFEYIETEEAVANDVVINEFYAIPDAESGIPNAEFVELYNRSSKFIDLENWTLNDASGSSSSFSAFILRPDSYVIVCRDSDAASFDSFGDVLGLSSVPSLNNSSDNVVIRNSVADTIYITSYTSATSGITTELINPNGPDYSSNNYGLSIDPHGGTPGEQNAIFDDTPDTTPPSIESIAVQSAIELLVTFNEPVGQVTAEDDLNYSIDGGISVSSAIRDGTDNSLVTLVVSALTSGEVSTLTINGVEDLSGNAIVNETIDFEHIETEEAVANDVLINEFYAIPDAESGIPNAEFVELYNRSSKFIDMENWTLNDASGSSSSFSSFILRPDSYVIVCRDSDAASFDSFGDVLGLSSVPSLNNSSDNVVIRNSVSDTIHITSYTLATSGITTELINPNGPDFSENNYGLSTDADGGTPGEQNSIFDDTPDTTPPSIESIDVISSTELDVTFDEPLEKTSAEDITNYSVDDGIIVSGTSLDASNINLVHLTVSTLVSAEVRTLTVNGVEDLSGNVIVDETTDFEYIETEEAVANDVVINEFYAISDAESGIPNAEFIELYNRSSKFIDLENWTLNDASGSSSSFGSFVLRPDSYVIVCRDSDAASFDSFGDVLGLSSVPSLNNSSDNVVIRNSVSDTIHVTSYTSATSGITTELINPNGPDYSSNNYGLSTDPDGGTPGEQNSIFDDTPDTTPPSIESIEVISSTELDVTFDEPLGQSTAEDITNYSIDGGITVISANLDASNSSLVRLTVSTLVSAEVRTLTVNAVEDLSGNAIVDETIDFEYIEAEEAETNDVVINEFIPTPDDSGGIPNAEFIELYNRSSKFIDLENWTLADATSSSNEFSSSVLRPDSYVILTEAGNESLFSSFGDVVGISNFPSLNNSGDLISVQDSTGQVIAQIAYSSSEPGISTELINPDDPCLSIESYDLSINTQGGTPGAQNSIFDNSPDLTPPTIESFGFSQSLTINFSEIMDAVSLANGSYSINNLTIDGVNVSGDFSRSVTISFLEEAIAGVVYEMTISNISDCAGNPIEETSIQFSIGRSPLFNEVIITEILFDEEPAVGLPAQEFIEIYNTTSDIISTDGMQLTDATSTADIPVFNLEPQTYYVLTTSTGASEFEVNAMGFSGFPSLNNSGELLILSLNEELLFSIEYDPEWNEEEKRGGGYSLEMVDLSNPCVEDNNWRSSVNPNGGTPGMVNSITESIPDNFGPSILEIKTITADILRVLFDEKINPSLLNSVSANFSPSLVVDQIFFDLTQPSSLYIALSQDLEESVPYTLSLENVFDCNGNEVTPDEFSFALPSTAEVGEIKLTEVLFNPRTNGVDFVEIFNDSERYLELKNWNLARITDEGIDDLRIISEDQLVIKPNEYLVFTTDTDILLNNYPSGISSQFVEVASLPTYANDTGNVVLLNALGEMQEQFFYSEDFHYNLLESVDGVSLERVSLAANTNDPNNWRSASSTEGFATPGYTNSQALQEVQSTGEVTINPKVFLPGNAGTGRDFTAINYEFQNAGQFANVNIYDQLGRLVRNLVQGELLSTSGFLRWDGVTNTGEMARLGYYVVVFEVFDASGNSETLKETVVVGRDF